MTKFAPMLAERESAHNFADELVFPLHMSPKLDGIRCVIRDGVAQLRSLTPIANNHIREQLSRHEMSGFDGELICGDPTAENCYNATQRAVLGNKIERPVVAFYIFDDFTSPTCPYIKRIEQLWIRFRALSKAFPMAVWAGKEANSWAEVEAFESDCLQQGYEGVILRSPLGQYKYGRSTRKQQGMLKMKRFIDFEFEVMGFEELMRNGNEDVRDNLGHAKRSSAQAGLIAGDTLGVIIGRITDPGATKFEVGTPVRIGMFKGLTAEDKLHIWRNRGEYVGKIGKASCFAAIDNPRHAKFIGWRDAADMS